MVAVRPVACLGPLTLIVLPHLMPLAWVSAAMLTPLQDKLFLVLSND